MGWAEGLMLSGGRVDFQSSTLFTFQVTSQGRYFQIMLLRLPRGFLCGSAGEESVPNVGDLGSIPGLGRSPGKGKGYPLQYSGLENSMDSPWSREVRHNWATFTRVPRSTRECVRVGEAGCEKWLEGKAQWLKRWTLQLYFNLTWFRSGAGISPEFILKRVLIL